MRPSFSRTQNPIRAATLERSSDAPLFDLARFGVGVQCFVQSCPTAPPRSNLDHKRTLQEHTLVAMQPRWLMHPFQARAGA